EAQEGKLFKPLAYTKTFALTSAFILGIVILPTLAYYLYSIRLKGVKMRKFANYLLVVAGIGLWIYSGFFVAFALTLIGINNLFTPNWKGEKLANYVNVAITLFVALYYLTVEWLPLGTRASGTLNFVFVFLAIGTILGMLWVLVIYYEQILQIGRASC